MIAEYFPAGLMPAIQPQVLEVAPGLEAQRHLHTPVSLRELARGLRKRAPRFRKMPSVEVLAGLAEVHSRWAERTSRERAEAVSIVHTATGYPESIIDESLQRLFSGMTQTAMRGWLHFAGVHPQMLDGPVPGSLLRTWVFGPKLTAVISSGNVPGAALPSVVQALLLKSPCLVKTATAEPFLLPLYARSLARHCPEVAEALAVTHWEGGSEELEQGLLAEVEAMVAYGSDVTLQSLHSRLPLHARFLGYGHRISFTAIGRELLGSEGTAYESALRAAYDLCVFDQQGCYSPQAIYVEAGGTISPARFAELLGDALDEYAHSIPRRPIGTTEAASIHQYRTRMEMRGFSDPETRVWISEVGTGWTVALAPTARLEPCVLNRTAVVVPLADLAELPGVLEGSEQYLLSAVLGVSEQRLGDLAATLGMMGVNRIAQLGRAQAPESPRYHDGVNALAHLARFVTVDLPRCNQPRADF